MLTTKQIAEGRKEAKHEYDAKMTFFAAAEALNHVMGVSGAAEPQQMLNFEPAAKIDHPPELKEYAFTEAAFRDLETIKDRILLALYQSCRSPAAINDRLKELKLVTEDYPSSNISPKLHQYRIAGLVKRGTNGWSLGDAGRLRLLETLAVSPNREGASHAA